MVGIKQSVMAGLTSLLMAGATMAPSTAMAQDSVNPNSAFCPTGIDNSLYEDINEQGAYGDRSLSATVPFLNDVLVAWNDQNPRSTEYKIRLRSSSPEIFANLMQTSHGLGLSTTEKGKPITIATVNTQTYVINTPGNVLDTYVKSDGIVSGILFNVARRIAKACVDGPTVSATSYTRVPVASPPAPRAKPKTPITRVPITGQTNQAARDALVRQPTVSAASAPPAPQTGSKIPSMFEAAPLSLNPGTPPTSLYTDPVAATATARPAGPNPPASTRRNYDGYESFFKSGEFPNIVIFASEGGQRTLLDRRNDKTLTCNTNPGYNVATAISEGYVADDYGSRGVLVGLDRVIQSAEEGFSVSRISEGGKESWWTHKNSINYFEFELEHRSDPNVYSVSDTPLGIGADSARIWVKRNSTKLESDSAMEDFGFPIYAQVLTDLAKLCDPSKTKPVAQTAPPPLAKAKSTPSKLEITGRLECPTGIDCTSVADTSEAYRTMFLDMVKTRDGDRYISPFITKDGSNSTVVLNSELGPNGPVLYLELMSKGSNGVSGHMEMYVPEFGASDGHVYRESSSSSLNGISETNGMAKPHSRGALFELGNLVAPYCADQTTTTKPSP